MSSPILTAYQTPQSGWQSTTYTYDGLGRVVTQTNPDGTSTSNDYSQPWQINVTNAKGLITKDYYDAFNRLVEVQEPNSDNSVYATTNYSYDVLGNLIQVEDANSNTTTMTYDWLSRKTGMTDPDMGTWSYSYDNNGNLTTQTDAKGQTITMVYDAMNRLTNKNYPTGSGMTNVVYSYDSTAGGNYGLGLRTGMTDASGTNSDVYDSRGRLAQETKTISSVPYTTTYTYDGLDRVATVTYPTGETVTNTYNGRGLPNTVSGSTVGNLVTNTLYNQLGNITEIDLNNGLKTTYGYYGTGGTYDTTGGYYGQLWEIKTLPQGGGTSLQDLQYTWDANGNLTTRQNLVASQTENFTYDSLDRLTGVSGAYTQSYAYNTIGDITSMNGTSYSYGSQPQAVTAIGSTNYAYDANGNMTTRGTQTLTWDVENRPLTITGGASFVYDGDGNRIEQTENGQTTLYINQYYEKNITTGVVTTSYYLGGQLIAQNAGGTLKYIHQDSLGSSSVMSTSTGTLDSSISFYPFGATRTGSVSTAKEFTGQRLDQTGLYYYNARYYDPLIGRFISPDTAAPDLINPQSFNKYTYCFNNPLKYTDPTGLWPNWSNIGKAIKSGFQATVNAIKANPIGVLSAVATIAVIAIVAAPVAVMAAGMISAAIAGGGIAGLGTLAAATVGIGTTAGVAAVEEGPEIESGITNNVSTVENLIEGDAYLNTAGCGLPDSIEPGTLYHYSPMGPDVIMNKGINCPSGINYATNEPSLSPLEADTGLNLGGKLPTHVYGIDVPAFQKLGGQFYGPWPVEGPDGSPTGQLEWLTGEVIPRCVLSPIK